MLTYKKGPAGMTLSQRDLCCDAAEVITLYLLDDGADASRAAEWREAPAVSRSPPPGECGVSAIATEMAAADLMVRDMR